MPALYQGTNAVLPQAATIYYRRGTLAEVSPFPNNLRVIAGDAAATSPQGMRVTSWSCGLASGLDRSATVPTCPDTRGSFLRLHIRFPECWNGRQLDSADHKSHMAYATRSGCPSTHPVEVPQITQIYRYPSRGGEGFSLASGGQYSRARGLRERVEAGSAPQARGRLLERARPLRARLSVGRGSGSSQTPFTRPEVYGALTDRRYGQPPCDAPATRLRFFFLVLATLSLAATASTGASAEPATTPPVPSLEPAKTAALWSRLVSTRARQAAPAAECRPLRAVFYAASDWLRLATKLAATASPCAEYFVSIPPLVADKTTFRRDQAWRIRALGANFHAMAEIHFATWTRWVQSTGNSWHVAGVTARERMAAAGYDVALGDTWALNELTSAVRRGDGNARTNIREFLRGLYEGDGSRPTRGAALVIGFGQRTADVSAYQNTLQGWLADTSFWTDMATYVSDWSQEVYGDLRSYAVPGSDVSSRREYLNDYLQHKLVLAGAGPAEIEPARAYLRDAYSPLANGAWPRETAWGWTMVPFEQMAAYVSAQVDAMRFFSVSAGQSRDHWGFAWAPSNTTGLSTADFAAQTGQILDRMAAAIRDSAVADPENLDSGACGAGQTLCAVDLPEASHNGAWRSFRAWAQSTLSIGPVTPIRVVAGIASAPLELSVASAVARPVAVTLRSSSPGGAFSTSVAGPWTSSLTVAVAPGTVGSFFYRDTRAGVATVTAEAPGTTRASREVTVAAGADDACLGDACLAGGAGARRDHVHGRGDRRLRERHTGKPDVEHHADRARDARPRPRRRGDVQGGTRAGRRNRHGDGEPRDASSAPRTSSCAPQRCESRRWPTAARLAESRPRSRQSTHDVDPSQAPR